MWCVAIGLAGYLGPTALQQGIPLARINDLLLAQPDDVTRALEDVDRSLHREIRRLQRHRQQVARLSSPDGPALPDDVVTYLTRLCALGVSERGIEMERDGWILIAARAPGLVNDWMRLKHEALDDESYRHLYLLFDQAHAWDPDEPRLPELADGMTTYLCASASTTDDAEPEDRLEETVVSLLDSHVLNDSPAWRRLANLLEERGWKGWTELSRSDDGAR